MALTELNRSCAFLNLFEHTFSSAFVDIRSRYALFRESYRRNDTLFVVLLPIIAFDSWFYPLLVRLRARSLRFLFKLNDLSCHS